MAKYPLSSPNQQTDPLSKPRNPPKKKRNNIYYLTTPDFSMEKHGACKVPFTTTIDHALSKNKQLSLRFCVESIFPFGFRARFMEPSWDREGMENGGTMATIPRA